MNAQITPTRSPVFTNPKALLVWCTVNARPLPFTLIAGSNWLVYDNGTWTVNADEPATNDQVEAILVEAGGITHWWNSEEPV